MSTVTELMLSIRENTNGLNFWDREESETSLKAKIQIERAGMSG